jgi:cytoskeletal protein RodZ
LPRPSEQTSEPNTLPPAELNPLINPLLAENMGRWAEVYFTSPPENRERAVLDLLRELEAEKSRRETTLASELAAVPPLVRCRNCGHDNPAVNKFCGMCGADTASEDSGTAGYSKTPIRHDSRRNSASDSEPEPERWSERSSSYDEPVAPRHELSLFQAYRETESDNTEQDWNFEPAPSSSYRGYIGAVLAILILGLGYFAWRGMQNSQISHDISAPPPASASAPSSTTQPPTGNQTAPPPKVEHPEATASPTNPETAPADTRNEAPPEPAAKAPSTAPADVPARQPSPPRASESNEREAQPESAADKWGAEELSMAERYLNGTSGQRRDPAEAAKWLWKSIAKHNGQATLRLADMYLRGDGVSKNCDQARILLDSAARKGVNGAGQRLRNLQAFGCQ